MKTSLALYATLTVCAIALDCAGLTGPAALIFVVSLVPALAVVVLAQPKQER